MYKNNLICIRFQLFFSFFQCLVMVAFLSFCGRDAHDDCTGTLGKKPHPCVTSKLGHKT